MFGNPSLTPDFLHQENAFWFSVSNTIFFQKFITVFSALFGAGIVLMMGEDKQTSKIAIHRRRMFWLLIIGMLHAYFLWYGDILVPYAITGFIIAAARKWNARTLVLIGTVLIILNYAIFYLQHWSFGFMSPEELAEINTEMWAPSIEALNLEISKYRESFFNRSLATAGDSLMFQVIQTFLFGLRTAGVMMVGMTLFKTGFFTLRWKRSVYALLAVFGIGIGGVGSYWGTAYFISVNFDFATIFPGQAALYWASLAQAFGYSALIMLCCSLSAMALIRKPFAAVGRMALSNYLASTVIGVLVFYGPPGLGKIGTMEMAELPIVVAGVWLFILIWSPLWLAIFRFGPAEWVWRSLSYGQAQPILKTANP